DLNPFEMWRSHTQTSLGVQSEPSYNTHTLIPFSQKAHKRMARGQTSDLPPPTAPRPFPGFPEIRTVSPPPPLDLILSHTRFSPLQKPGCAGSILRHTHTHSHTHTHTAKIARVKATHLAPCY